MGIPVYLSRYSVNLPTPYGAMIAWNPGEKAVWVRKNGNRDIVTHTTGEMMQHEEAPVIQSARGKGRWVYEDQDVKRIRSSCRG